MKKIVKKCRHLPDHLEQADNDDDDVDYDYDDDDDDDDKKCRHLPDHLEQADDQAQAGDHHQLLHHHHFSVELFVFCLLFLMQNPEVIHNALLILAGTILLDRKHWQTLASIAT